MRPTLPSPQNTPPLHISVGLMNSELIVEIDLRSVWPEDHRSILQLCPLPQVKLLLVPNTSRTKIRLLALLENHVVLTSTSQGKFTGMKGH